MTAVDQQHPFQDVADGIGRRRRWLAFSHVQSPAQCRALNSGLMQVSFRAETVT